VDLVLTGGFVFTGLVVGLGLLGLVVGLELIKPEGYRVLISSFGLVLIGGFVFTTGLFLITGFVFITGLLLTTGLVFLRGLLIVDLPILEVLILLVFEKPRLLYTLPK
tara:strand:+ start:2749 stop:3072 length:324 start_codon:yes stop_codon:yes gene_type:complete